MSSGLAETAGFETQTPDKKQPEGEVDYSFYSSLIEAAFLEAFLNKSTNLPELIIQGLKSGDETLKSIALDNLPRVLQFGVDTKLFDDDTMDGLRAAWRDEIESANERNSYEAQEIFVLEEQRLLKQDITTHQWLGERICREWFDG